MTTTSRAPRSADDGQALAPNEIADLIWHHSGASRAVLDQHYELTAVMIRRRSASGTRQELLVEVIHEARGDVGREWMLVARDDLRDSSIGPKYGSTLPAVLAEVVWDDLDVAAPTKA